MISKPANRIKYLSLLALLLIGLLVGCKIPIDFSSSPFAILPTAQAQTQANLPQFSVLNLPDGSNIIPREGAEIGIIMLAQLTGGMAENLAAIENGEALVVSQLPPGAWFTVTTPKGFIARVSSTLDAPGGTMLINYDPSNGKLTLGCIRGICQLGPDLEHLEILSATKMGWLDHIGKYTGPSDVEMSSVESIYGDQLRFIVKGAFAPPISSTSEAKITPTSINETQAVNETSTVNPKPVGTDLPTLSPDGTTTTLPGFAATATATCKQFKLKYPATPCP